MSSKLIRRGLIATVSVGTIALILVGAAHLSLVRARVFDWAREQAEQRFGVIVQAESLGYNLLTASVELRNPTFATRGERPFLRADSVRLIFSRRVLWGTIEIQRLELARPRVTLVRHANGTTNLPVSQTDPSSGTTPLQLGIVELRQISVEIEDEGAGNEVSAGPIDLTFDSRSTSPRPGAFGPGPFTVSLAATANTPAEGSLSGTLAGRLGFDGARLTVPELDVRTPEGRLTLNGWIDFVTEAFSVEAQGQLDLDLARAGRFIGASGAALAGSARAQFAVRGSLADPVVRIDVVGQDVSYRSVAAADLSAKATYTAGRLEIETLDVTSSVGAAHVSGELTLTNAPGIPGTNRILARITNLHLDPLLEVAGVALPVRLGSNATGELKMTLERAPPFRPDWLQDLAANGSIRIMPAGSGLSIGGQLDFHLDGGRWTIAHALQSATGHAALFGEVSGRMRPGASGEIDSTLSGRSRLRLDELRALIPVLQKAGVHVPPPFDDRISGSLDAWVEPRGTIASPRMLATVSGRAIQVADFPAGDLDSTLAVDLNGVQAQSLEARLGPTRLVASGEYTWQGQIDTEFAVTADDLDALARAFEMTELGFAGAARLEGSLQGEIRSPRALGSLTAQRLSISDTAIGALNAKFDLAGQRLNIDARATDLNVQLQGDVDTREPFAYQASATLEGTSIPALLPPSLRDTIAVTDGTVTATVRAQGVLRRPLESAGEVALGSLDVVYSGVPIHLDSPATVSMGPDIITATPVQLRLGRDTLVRLQGELARDEPREGLQVRLDGTLSELFELAEPSLPDWQLGIDASRISLDLRVGGTLRAPAPAGTVTLRAAALRYGDLPPLTDVALDARIERAQITLQSLVAEWEGATLMTEGAVPLRMIVPEPPSGGGTGTLARWRTTWLASLPSEPTSATLVARVTGITPRALAPFVEPSQLQEIAGTVAATVTAEADTFAIDGIRASVVLDEASLVMAGVPIAQSSPTRLRLENGTARIENLHWDAQGNEVIVSGGAKLTGPNPVVDLAAKGTVDLRILGAFASGFASAGLARADVSVKGPLTLPEIIGSIGITAGEIRIDDPPLAASDFDGIISIAADRMATVSLNGLINGGSATLAGEVSMKDPSDPRGRASLTARNVMLEYPDGFRTESNADLTLTLAAAGSAMAGHIEVLNGTYREPIMISRGLLGTLTENHVVTTTTESSFLANLRLDVTVATAEDLAIDNNYGRLNLAANLRVTGTADRPGAVGRIEALPDGEIYLGGNTYRILNLIVDLTNPLAIAPDLTFLAETRVGNVPIEVALACTAAGPCERDVRSQAAGVTNQEAEELLFGISTDPSQAGAQLARLLSAEVLGIVGRTVGLDTLRLEQGVGQRSDLFDDPSLVAGDVNPASRLTFGKRLGERVELAYSQDLAQNGFTTSTSYFAPAGISFKALLLDDQSRAFEFRHEPRFGAPRRQESPTEQPTIAAVRFGGTPGFSERELRVRLRLTEGDRFDFARWQEDRLRLSALYQSRGYFEARVRGRRLPALPGDVPAAGSSGPSVEAIVLEYTIEQGRPTRLDVSGFDLPEDIRSRIVERWSGATFAGFLERDATLIVREHLAREGRLQAKVVATMGRDDAEGAKTLRIDVDPGPTMIPRLQFEGNALVGTSTLLEVAEGVGQLTAWLDPAFFELAIERLYQEEGLLSADVNVLQQETQNGVSVVRVVIQEGEPWRIGRVTLDGAGVLADRGTPDSLELQTGSRYDPRVIAESIAALEQRFREAGFLEVRVVFETVLNQVEHTAGVHVLAAPGPRSILSSIVVEGAPPESPLIARTVTLAVGMPVNASALSDARRRLSETGVYRRVDINLEPTGAVTTPVTTPAEGDHQVVARVRVEERPRYAFRYGLAVNDDVVGVDEREQRLGFAADLENRNVLGHGATVGLSARLRRDQQVGRVFVATSRFFGLPLRSNLFLSRSREEIGSTDKTVSDVTEISAEQTYRLRRFIDVRYGYGLGHNRSTFAAADFDLTVKVARLTTSGLVDHRNDPFDPARGWFTSAGLELSRPGLGSDLSFLKSFLQYFQFIPIRDNVIVASAARVGMARTFRDEDLIPSERFFGGGATSVRGYRQDDLGPRNIFDEASGGRALFIGSGELRFPIHRWLRGVGFVDLGNVYQTVSDMTLSNLQIGAGAGIRLDTPIGLLRLDVAVPTNPRSFDPKWSTYFGLGHAF